MCEYGQNEKSIVHANYLLWPGGNIEFQTFANQIRDKIVACLIVSGPTETFFLVICRRKEPPNIAPVELSLTFDPTLNS